MRIARFGSCLGFSRVGFAVRRCRCVFQGVGSALLVFAVAGATVAPASYGQGNFAGARVLWRALAADAAAFVPASAVRVETGLVTSDEVIPRAYNQSLTERLRAEANHREHLAKIRAIYARYGKTVQQVEDPVGSFAVPKQFHSAAVPDEGALPLSAALAMSECAFAVEAVQVESGWWEAVLSPAQVVYGRVRWSLDHSCVSPGADVAVLLVGGRFEWEGIVFASPVFRDVKRPEAGDTVLVLGRRWDLDPMHALMGVAASHAFPVEDGVVLPQPYRDIATREPVELAGLDEAGPGGEP